MITVSALLNAKGHHVISVSNEATVLETLELMAEKRIGAVLVLEGNEPVGIFSERDFARMTARTKNANLDIPIDSWITREVYCCSPDETLDELMALMTQKRIRHVPVKEAGKIIGIVSIGDVVKELIEDKDLLIQSMEKYIYGRGYGE